MNMIHKLLTYEKLSSLFLLHAPLFFVYPNIFCFSQVARVGIGVICVVLAILLFLVCFGITALRYGWIRLTYAARDSSDQYVGWNTSKLSRAAIAMHELDTL